MFSRRPSDTSTNVSMFSSAPVSPTGKVQVHTQPSVIDLDKVTEECNKLEKVLASKQTSSVTLSTWWSNLYIDESEERNLEEQKQYTCNEYRDIIEYSKQRKGIDSFSNHRGPKDRSNHRSSKYCTNKRSVNDCSNHCSLKVPVSPITTHSHISLPESSVKLSSQDKKSCRRRFVLRWVDRMKVKF